MTPAIEDDERERRLAAVEEQGGGRLTVVGGSGGGMRIDQEQVRNMMRGQIEGMVFAREVPVIAGLSVDQRDRIWVERSGTEVGEDGPIDVVASDGSYLGTIAAGGLRIPDAFGPDGLAAFVERDELDVQTVRVARVGDLEE